MFPSKRMIGVALALALAASGCFAQSGEMAENCDSLRKTWSQAQADMRTVIRDRRLDTRTKSQRLTAIADQLHQESQSIKDEQLRAAMSAVATDIKTMAQAFGGIGSRPSAVPPLPPATSIQKLSKAMDERCPV